jgi:anti-sigma-K factor RskA
MTDREDMDASAAEFVLGTLDQSERTAVAARRQREPLLDAAIQQWELRLGPLHEVAPSVEPSPDLWSKIEARIALSKPTSVPGYRSVVGLVTLEQRLTRWRRVALSATSVAAALLVVIGVREVGRSAAPRNYVAVFQKDDALPTFLLTIDLETRLLTIRSVAAETPPGKSYQLWIATGQSGGKPSSLGLIEERGLPTRAALTAYDPATVQVATFGISLEPSGGSPTGQPTGPVFHAKLIKAP